MPSFSERYGHREVPTLIQREDLDEATRTDFWNLFYISNSRISDRSSSSASSLAHTIWARFLGRAADEFSFVSDTWGRLKKLVLEGDWYLTFDLAEFLLSSPIWNTSDHDFGSKINVVCQRNMVGYRLINGAITPIDSAEEADAISAALGAASTTPLAGVRHHLANAIDKLADRSAPDYPNSVKESISAVEAMLEILTKDGVLSKALRKLNAVGIVVHPALLDAWVKMYGWTSDENGVRHSAAAPPTVDQATAKYMLVTCSSFVSWLIEEGRKANAIR